MNASCSAATAAQADAPPLSAHVITETAARARFRAQLDAEHTLGAPQSKGRRLYQVIARGEKNLENAVVTADSLHCQDLTAHLITRDKGGDYLLQVRDNQPTMHHHAQTQLAAALPLFATPASDAAASKNGP